MMPDMLTIRAGVVITPDERLTNQRITVRGGKITQITLDTDDEADPNWIDARDKWVIPGLIDLQVNGALGYSWQVGNREHFDTIVDYHLRSGTTTLLPTLITHSEGQFQKSNSLYFAADFWSETGINRYFSFKSLWVARNFMNLCRINQNHHLTCPQIGSLK